MHGTEIVFLGGLFPRTGLDRASVDLDQYGLPDQAANVYQWNLLTGIEAALGRPIGVVSAPFLRHYPGGRRIVPGFSWQHGGSDSDISVGFVDILGIRNLTREVGLARVLRPRIGKAYTTASRVILLIYAMHGPFLQQLGALKHQYPDLLICLVVPDLPEHMQSTRGHPLIGGLKRLDMRRNRPMQEYIDQFILISEHQAELLHISEEKYIVVEGMVDTNLRPHIPEAVMADDPFYVVYTGALDLRYGIREMVDALDYIADPRLRMVFCGGGEATAYLEYRASLDERIILAGRVRHVVALDWQRRAGLLINPRSSMGAFTRYSFPSKTLEYMASGNLVATYQNEGIPREYYSYFMSINGEGPEAIARVISAAIAMPAEERARQGRAAREFVFAEKSIESQTTRILEFLGVDP